MSSVTFSSKGQVSERFNFNNLFVLDLANNHQGSLEHGRRIVREIGAIVRERGARAACKFQFRDLDTFIHPAHRTTGEHKQVRRFLDTKLEMADFDALLAEVRREGMVTMCTPFDEKSVDAIAARDFDIIKVASCSAKDWPLLERVAEAGKPVIFSTGGLRISDVDQLVSFFEHRGVDFAMMHCVAIYPTPDQNFHLNKLDVLRRRYRARCIGWSTHEMPGDIAPVHIAVAKGAVIFERHVGIATGECPLNSYSSTPEQIGKWIDACRRAQVLCGSDPFGEPVKAELDSLDSLKRGVYAARRIVAGERLEAGDAFFAIPFEPGQLDSGQFKAGLIAIRDLDFGQRVLASDVHQPPSPDRLVIQSGIHEAKALLNEANIALNSEFTVEYSHHYGIQKFRETGAIIINCFNRGYCKKLILQLAGQHHPLHFHKLKEETFQVLYGELYVEVDGHRRVLHPGETVLILPGLWHCFWTETGVIFEEISTTHFNGDSYYKDKAINRMARAQRKTVVDHWGRFQLFSESELRDSTTTGDAQQSDSALVSERTEGVE